MATLGKHVDPAQRARFERQQQGHAQRQQAGFGKLLEGRKQLHDSKGSAMQAVADKLVEANDALYKYLAKGEDARHLGALAGEIEARFAQGAQGVLLQRITQRLPDSAGNFAPRYIGLQVVGQGDTELLAVLDYTQRQQADSPAAPGAFDRLTAVCTPLNPTGGTQKAPAVLRAAPEGFNMAYGSMVAGKVMGVMEVNPRNVGRIDLGDNRSPLQPRAYLDREFIFVSREAWGARK